VRSYQRWLKAIIAARMMKISNVGAMACEAFKSSNPEEMKMQSLSVAMRC